MMDTIRKIKMDLRVMEKRGLSDWFRKLVKFETRFPLCLSDNEDS